MACAIRSQSGLQHVDAPLGGNPALALHAIAARLLINRPATTDLQPARAKRSGAEHGLGAGRRIPDPGAAITFERETARRESGQTVLACSAVARRNRPLLSEFNGFGDDLLGSVSTGMPPAAASRTSAVTPGRPHDGIWKPHGRRSPAAQSKVMAEAIRGGHTRLDFATVPEVAP